MCDFKTTISDIADRAKVSKMTVSRVLSGKGPVAEKTAERIREIMEEMNYQPNLIARSLSSQKTMTIGVVIPKTEKLFLDNYIAQVLSGVTDVAQMRNYRIMLLPIDLEKDKHGSYMNHARSKLIDGMILLKTKIDDPFLVELADSSFPFVLVNHKPEGGSYNYVDTENVIGAKLAITYLHEKGHTNIAFICGAMNESNAKDRLEGYKTAMLELGLEVRNENIVCGEFSKEKAFNEVGKLLALGERPTAIFCSDDYMAIGAIEKIKSEGLKVPDDIAVIGFDNIEIGPFVRPTLTTVKQPMYELGESAANILLELIEGVKEKPISKLLPTELIIRNSV